jgi:hypothetical protein
MLYISNAFSINMLGQQLPQQGLTVRVRPIDLGDVQGLLMIQNWESAVGHESTARVITLLTGVEIPVNRVAITLSPGDSVIVFQLKIRLEEGRILSEEEVQALLKEGKASFAIVEVL